jgi:hypothetical protein
MGLQTEQKRSRRNEVQSDMYEERGLALLEAAGSWSVQRQTLSRMFRGAPFDMLWRWDAGRDEERQLSAGGNAPMPWFSSLFLGAVVLVGAVSSAQVEWWGDAHVSLAMLAMFGAGVSWWGLYLATHRLWGPLLIACGTVCIAWSLWWTVVVPIAAVVFGVAGVRRAQRLEKLLDS